MRSLHGTNPDYGAPVNPTCPHRMVGASSGGAAAVAAGEADFAVVIDTLASTAVPATYCGQYAFRSTPDAQVRTHTYRRGWLNAFDH